MVSFGRATEATWMHIYYFPFVHNEWNCNSSSFAHKYSHNIFFMQFHSAAVAPRAGWLLNGHHEETLLTEEEEDCRGSSFNYKCVQISVTRSHWKLFDSSAQWP